MTNPLHPRTHAGRAPQRLRRRRRRSVPPTVFSGTIFRLRPRLEVIEDRTLLSTFVVSNTGDSGPGSLRQAIVDSNNATGATNTIDFDISGSGVQTINPLSPLPAITNPVLIDGASQPGYSGTPLIELSGSQAGGGDGLTITGAGVSVRDLDINNFSQGAGIHITGTGATGNWVYGNFLGTDPTGTQAEPDDYGVEIDGGASGNLIGTNGDGVNDAAERNLLSGDLFAGVWITGQGTDGNSVAGNYIGTDITGSVALNNGTEPISDSFGNVFGGGIAINDGASGNRIGTDGKSVDDAGERNIVAGSNNDAIDIWGAGTDGNIVAGNFIGTDVTGTYSLGIDGDGVFLAEGASSNWIGVNPMGGTAVGDEGNVISGNGYDGVQIDDAGTDSNVVAGDRIGTDVTGTVALGNSDQGVEVDSGSVDNTIGATNSASGNLISANHASGVWINGDGATGNVFQGNKIGTDITGTVALGNFFWGVVLQEAANNTVGGLGAGAGNLVSGNDQGGVGIRGIDAVGDVVQGNLIGTDVTGTKALGNAYSGVYVGDWGVSGDAASAATIGGTAAGAGNVISDNGNWGVWITGKGTTGVVVQGNMIGTDVTGTVALGNAYAGVQIDTGASENTIGGATARAGNLITGNGGAGVVVGNSVDDTTVGNEITANRIFGNKGQAIDLGNDGVTYNSTSPRIGPNDFQNFPMIFPSADGQLEGGLWGSSPDSIYRVDLFASAAYGPGGAGEAQDYLGSLEVTTDSQGQAVFDVPFSPPAGLPIVTATATDPNGNTSEVSGLRRGELSQPVHTPRAAPGQSVVLSAAAGDGIALQDPDAGPFDLTWSLTLTASAGTLTLSNTTGLTGSGNGTNSLAYSGPLSALNVALENMNFTAPAGLNGNATLSVGAQSDGASPFVAQVQIIVTTGRFEVTNTDDTGPGSLRQAILDSNTETGGTNTIDFAILGQGVQAIAPLSPLPAITNPVLIDGFSQPAYSGTPLVELSGSQDSSGDGLTITGPEVIVRGLDISGFSQGGAGIDLTGTGASGDWIYGNFLGTDPTGTEPESDFYGIKIDGGASGNLVGTNGDGVNDAAERNLIAGCLWGVWINGQGTDGNVVAGNLIGTTVTGDVAMVSGAYPDYENVYIGDGASANWIGVNPNGGLAFADEGNVISAGEYGVVISGANSNAVAGNKIGTDQSGVLPIPNTIDGVEIKGGSSDNTIGGTTSGAGNLISDNSGPGVAVDDTSVGDAILENSIYANTGPAIDLDDDGVIGNSTAPRQGSNNLQNFPIILPGADGRLEGWLGGGLPDTTFRIEVLASASYGAGGSGDAQDYLGSLEVTTDATGQVSFAVPFTAPAGLPIITATATDPQGDTSEVSSSLPGGFQAQSEVVRLAPGQESVAFSTASGDSIELQDSTAGSSGVTWDLSLSVSAGTLTLPSAAGLVGSGDGTGSLFYTGTLSAINAAIDGMIYAPPSGLHGNASLSAEAQSDGINLLAGQVIISDGPFVVTTTADSGPGSLRQAILDSNAATGATNTIDFDIPGSGVRTIVPLSPLPPITTAVLIDGTTQPGYAGAPLIAIAGQGTADAVPLSADADATLKGLAISGSRFLSVSSPTEFAIESVPPPQAPGATVTYQIIVAADEDLVATAQAVGATPALSLLDAQGQIVMQSDGLSATEPIDAIDTYIRPGTYSLEVHEIAGNGSLTLTTMMTPSVAPFQPIPVGTLGFPSAIVAGDFNGDGKLDLAVVDYNYSSVTNSEVGEVSVLLGNGDGTFQPPVQYAVGSSPYSDSDAIVAGDFAGDGRLDLAVTNSADDTVSVLLGNGDGTFQPQVTYAVGAWPDAIVAGDFTGNGRLDLAVADDFGASVSVLLGNGDGTFQSQVAYAVGNSPHAIVAGDFADNGHLDLAVADSSGYVSVLMGNGDGTFQPAVQYAAGSGPESIVAGDFAGNGHLDLAVAGSSGYVSGYVSVLMGNGDGTFQPAVPYGVAFGATSIVAGDFTGDGRLDLVVGGDQGTQILLGNGNGTFEPVKTVAAIGSGYLVAGDFNGDGRLDLAAIGSDFSTDTTDLYVLLGNGDGTFQTPVENAVGSLPAAIVAGDFTGDGRLDLAVADIESNDVAVLLGNGDGTFEPAVQYAVGAGPIAIVAGDFNGDGRLDLAVSDSDGVQILLGNGDGTFEPAKTVAAGIAGDLVAGDFTGDGPLDLAVAGGDTNDVVSVLLGNGDGTFQPAVQYAVGSGPSAIVAGDFSGDGKLDLAVTNALSGNVSILMGNGDGTFQPQVTYAVGSLPESIVAGDFTGDGRLDLAVANLGPGTLDSDTVSVLLDNGDGTFQPQVTYALASASSPMSIVAGDFTGDGKLDLAVANDTLAPGTVSVLLGNGDGTFLPQVTYPVGVFPGAIAAGDFNGDGKSDLAVANGGSNDVSVLLGTGAGTLVDPGQFATIPLAAPLVADVTGDGTDDTLVVDGSGDILYRHGIPGAPGSFLPPVTINPGFPSRDIALVTTPGGPIVASVDAQDDGVSLYEWRNGAFVRIGSLSTGQFPAQIIAADLDDDGWDDLVVRNAGDGTLSVFYANKFIGPINPGFIPSSFLPPVTLNVGLGISDVQAVDTTGSGRLDLVVTNKLTGQVSVLMNLGDGRFAAPVPHRAGTGLSAVDPSSTPEVTSLDATAGVASGTLTPGGPASLVTINPGSYTLDVLAGLGGGRFANPVAIQTQSPAQVVRMGDFTGDGLDDLAVLTADGLSIYLANGQGGFSPPTAYAVPAESDGLTVTDLLGNGKLDLLVGDAYGDVLILLGNGDGTFQPFHEANQAIELAVADLTGNGSKDIIYADQGLDRVVVDYGAGNSSVLANQSTGLLDPGAVALADLNGNGIPDLIVANSGSNNVLIYPGLGNGQFGPAINDGNGYFVGTNPVGITVANLTGPLPDLVVADEGSNQVSILLNQSQKGGAISFSAGPRLSSGGSGPVSTVVGNFTGGAYPDMLVTNAQSSDVTLLPGVGQGFFNDQNPRIYAVGTDPGPTFVGNFSGQTDLVTVNAGANDLTLVAGFEGSNPTTSTISSGGVVPDTAFDFEGGDGLEDLVVGNAGDGALSLFEGGPEGLSLASVASEPNLPDPTALAFSALTGGQVQFYAATAGRESAELVALSLGIETATISQLASAAAQNTVAQLVALHEASLPLVATVLTLTITVPGDEINLGLAESEATAVAVFLTGTGVSVGQGLSSQGRAGPGGDDGAESDLPGAGAAGAGSAVIAPWERFVIGLDEAMEQFRRENPNGVSGAAAPGTAGGRSDSPPAAGVPAQGGPTSLKLSPNRDPNGDESEQTESGSSDVDVDALDAIIQSVWVEGRAGDIRERLLRMGPPAERVHDAMPRIRVIDLPFPRSLSPDQVVGQPKSSVRSQVPFVGSDRWIGEVVLRVPEPGKDEPDLALTSLVVAMGATRWVHAHRWCRTGVMKRWAWSDRRRAHRDSVEESKRGQSAEPTTVGIRSGSSR
jgi:FG-GAP-like repeat